MNIGSLGFDVDPIWEVLIRFFVNLLALFILIRLIYYRFAKNKKLAFPFFMMGIMMFLMCILLQHVEIGLGVGFGLFALFSVIRFRSENLKVKPLTYFFTIIGVSAINSMAQFYSPIRGSILINSIILLSAYILELSFGKKKI